MTFLEQPPGGDYSNCISTHAETNVLDWWVENLYHDGTISMYITRSPCNDCESYLRTMGVGKVFWPNGYLDLTPCKM